MGFDGGAGDDVPGLYRQHLQEDGQDARGFFHRGEGAGARRPRGESRTPGSLAEAGFRPGSRSCDGDLGSLQAKGLDPPAGAGRRETAPVERRGAMIGSTGNVAARLAASGSIAVAMIILALHAIRPEYQPSWRFISEYAIGPGGWIMQAAFLLWAASCAA